MLNVVLVFLIGLYLAIGTFSFAFDAATSRSFNVETDLDNPLLQHEGLPKFSRIKPRHLTPAVEGLLEKMQYNLCVFEDYLSQNNNDQADEVLSKLEQMKFELNWVWSISSHLYAVSNAKELREAYESNQAKVVMFLAAFSQSKPLYSTLLDISQQLEQNVSDDSFLMKQKRRALSKSLLEMKHGGVGLKASERARLNEIKMRLAALSTTFSSNILEETQKFSVTIHEKRSLLGVPESAKVRWHNSHRRHVTQSSESPTECNKSMSYLNWSENGPLSYEEVLYEEEIGNFGWSIGPWRITLDQPSYLAAMMHIPDRKLRKKIYMAHLQRASEQSLQKNNIPVIQEMLQQKQDMAKMLGYANYAEFSLDSKMASSVESITELTDLVAQKAIPVAMRELEEITAFALEYGGEEYVKENLDKLEPWDILYWTERLKESKFDLTEEELRPYLSLPNVLAGLFDLVNRLFDISVEAAQGYVDKWHSDVMFYHVFDNKSGDYLASFYLDPYSRSNKRGGAWMSSCIGKSNAVGKDYPVAYISCDLQPPHKGTPSLMTLREVTTLFHEFGHGLQHLLTTATVGDVSGINGIEFDAVETPSQFLERWCYDRATLYSFARHWRTGKPLPPDKFEKICQQKLFNAGLTTCKQLYFGQLDMELHSTFDPYNTSKDSIFDIQRQAAEKYVPYAMPLNEDRFLCSFSHIFAGGYSAAYYSYLWSDVMSADSFAAFEEAGLDDDNAVRRIGKKFRDTFLSFGGGVPPMETFVQFRGREPTPDALLRHNGLD